MSGSSTGSGHSCNLGGEVDPKVLCRQASIVLRRMQGVANGTEITQAAWHLSSPPQLGKTAGATGLPAAHGLPGARQLCADLQRRTGWHPRQGANADAELHLSFRFGLSWLGR